MEEIKELRKVYTQVHLAKLLAISLTYLRKLEYGERKNPSMKIYLRIMELFERSKPKIEELKKYKF